MIKKFLFFQIWIIIILFANAAWSADKISGNACYTCGDNESLVQAEQMTKTLAIRNAIESYSTFIESTTKITDFQLSTDLINTISTGQVKGVKVLKRLESGRKLCYTVEGYVEPFEMQNAIKKYLSGQKKGDDARVQENGWIRIIDHFVENLTPEEFYKVGPDHPLAKMDKAFKKLWVQIEFLKPCTASTLFREISEQYGKEWDKSFNDYAKYKITGRGLSPKSTAFLMLQLSKMPSADTAERRAGIWNEYEAHCEKHGIAPYEFMNDLYLPRFRCDDRLKVFVTFLSAGGELKTEGIIPIVNEKGQVQTRLGRLPEGRISFQTYFH